MTKYKCKVCGTVMEAPEGAPPPQHCGQACEPVPAEATAAPAEATAAPAEAAAAPAEEAPAGAASAGQ